MKYQVWIKAHDRKTLAVIAQVQVFDDGDRLECERIAETYEINPSVLFGPVVCEQDPIFSTETRIPGWGPLVVRGPEGYVGIHAMPGAGGSSSARGGGSSGGSAGPCPVSYSGMHAAAFDGRCIHCRMQVW